MSLSTSVLLDLLNALEKAQKKGFEPEKYDDLAEIMNAARFILNGFCDEFTLEQKRLYEAMKRMLPPQMVELIFYLEIGSEVCGGSIAEKAESILRIMSKENRLDELEQNIKKIAPFLLAVSKE